MEAHSRLRGGFVRQPVASPGCDRQSVVSPPLQIGGRYADKPNITYLLMAGAEFTRSVLTPISPQSIMSLIQAD